MQLWPERAEPLRKKQVRARQLILSRRLQMINPAYFNAACALDALFKTILKDGTHIEFTHHLFEFRSQMDDVKNMQVLINKRLYPSPTHGSSQNK